MTGKPVDTPREAVISGSIYFFLGLFMDSMMLMKTGYFQSLFPLWILFFLFPCVGIIYVSLGFYYHHKGLAWNEFFPWRKNKANRRVSRKYEDEEVEDLPVAGWWKICTACDAKVDLDVKKCPECGEKFDGSDAPSEKPPKIENLRSRICPSCGTPTVSRSMFCGVCGTWCAE